MTAIFTIRELLSTSAYSKGLFGFMIYSFIIYLKSNFWGLWKSVLYASGGFNISILFCVLSLANSHAHVFSSKATLEQNIHPVIGVEGLTVSWNNSVVMI